jgi:hypothetical protein
MAQMKDKKGNDVSEQLKAAFLPVTFFNVYRLSRMQAVVRGNALRRPSEMQFLRYSVI